MPFVILSCCACLRSTGRLMIFCQASHSRASSTKNQPDEQIQFTGGRPKCTCFPGLPCLAPIFGKTWPALSYTNFWVPCSNGSHCDALYSCSLPL
ncbi:hypothetical protein T01_13884, partial [Trichinella spiralis]